MDEDGGRSRSGCSRPGLCLQGFPCRWTESSRRVPSPFSSSGHHLRRAWAPRETSLNVCGVDASWTPGIQVQSPVLLGCPAWHCKKMGPRVLSRNSWLCKETARGSGEGRRERGERQGGLRLSQAPGRVQASGLMLSGARSPSPPPAPPPQAPRAALPLGSDSVGPHTSPGGLPWPLQGPRWMPPLPICCLCLFPLPGTLFPFFLLPHCHLAHPSASFRSGSWQSPPQSFPDPLRNMDPA